MKIGKCLTGVAMAALAFGSAAWAASPSSASIPSIYDSSTADPVYADGGTPTTLTPTMYLLDKTSFGKWLESANISIGGFAEGGYYYDTNNPRYGSGPAGRPGNGDAPTLIAFPGDYSNRPLLDQVDLMIQKTADTTKTFDFGFQAEQGYGIDDALIHSYGILDNRAPASLYNKFQFGRTVENYTDGEPDPNNQYDLVQGNVTLEVMGLQVKAGKFVTLIGNEVINPTGDLFYTHSYTFNFGEPLTQTGVLLSYTFPKVVLGHDLSITAGTTRGWNESTSDDNGEVDFLGEASTSITDKLSVVFNMSEGPEGYQFFAGDKGDSHNYWTLLEVIPSYAVSDQLTVSADCQYGDFPHGGLSTDATGALISDGNAQWYSVCAYADYKLCSYASINTRIEWYRDQGGFTGFLAGADNAPISANYYEGTVGVQIHPFPTNDILQWLQLRPEVRYDWSDRAVFNASHDSSITGSGDYSQFSVAMDVIMQY
ncbi:MAG TPA: outer membrane beta-barrel protein [Tepidisphaeraceae bacterium]|nr:outer membrane beta-barrel protein [Tepidisphaeraceae bacterium]